MTTDYVRPRVRNNRAEGKTVAACALSAKLAIFAAALLVSGILLHRFAGLLTPVALNIFGLAFLLAGFAILLASIGLLVVWQTARDGTAGALVAIGVALAVLAWPLSFVPHAMEERPINDITTDLVRPPEFVAAKRLRPKGALSTDYQGEQVAAIQRERYPDIRSVEVPRTDEEAFDLALRSLRKLGYQIVNEVRPEAGRAGLIEAVDRTLILGFKDDIAVRVTRQGRRARIDVRSASRWGRHDFGINATRVRAILTMLVEQLPLTVPTDRGTSGRRS